MELARQSPSSVLPWVLAAGHQGTGSLLGIRLPIGRDLGSRGREGLPLRKWGKTQTNWHLWWAPVDFISPGLLGKKKSNVAMRRKLAVTCQPERHLPHGRDLGWVEFLRNHMPLGNVFPPLESQILSVGGN